MRRCVILSGIPGSGKTTWAASQEWSKRSIVLSADSFFLLPGGEYRFDATKLGAAHAQCMRGFIDCCQAGVAFERTTIALDRDPPTLVVDNTCISSEEIAPYYLVSQAYGYSVELVTFHIDVDVAWKRNIHDVGRHTLKGMDERLLSRRLPPFWQVTRTNLEWNGTGWTAKLGF